MSIYLSLKKYDKVNLKTNINKKGSKLKKGDIKCL